MVIIVQSKMPHSKKQSLELLQRRVVRIYLASQGLFSKMLYNFVRSTHKKNVNYIKNTDLNKLIKELRLINKSGNLLQDKDSDKKTGKRQRLIEPAVSAMLS